MFLTRSHLARSLIATIAASIGLLSVPSAANAAQASPEGHQHAPTSVERTAPLSHAAALAQGLNPVAVLASSKCWYKYDYHKWHDFGVHDGDTWMQLNWCSSGGRITTYNVNNIGGKATVGGLSYNGHSSPNELNVGWEVRASVAFNFSVTWDHVYPCMQIRGGASGLYSTQTTCNLN